MSESLRMWLEILFNITYLIVVWSLVIAMVTRRDRLSSHTYPIAMPFVWAFGLLALGDTGHVGFRVWAYAAEGLEKTITIFGRQLGLVGLGALSTAVTVTFFYVLVLIIWKRRFNKSYGWFGAFLLIAAIVRLVVMAFSQNAWNSVVPPWSWSMYRNIPLMLQGLGVAYLILRDAREERDRAFTWVGVMILVSYTFYTPVILFIQQAPMLGMLMIPKTMAYVAIAMLAYKRYFAIPAPVQSPAAAD